MRCPKCGFISFDHLTACAKCGRDITQVAAELQGTSIKVEAPMFLSGALAAFSEAGASFEEHAMETDIDQGIDFDMDMGAEETETISMAEPEEQIDFSFEDEAAAAVEEEPERGFAETAEVEESDEAGTDIELAAEAEEASEVDSSDDAFVELDFLGAEDVEEDGGLEFDLEDFMDDIDREESGPSGSENALDVDIDLAEEEK